MSYKPNIAVAPGATIYESMVYDGINEKELAEKLNITEEELELIFKGEKEITKELSIRLNKVFTWSDIFWLEYENNYQQEKKRLGADCDVIIAEKYYNFNE